MKIPFMFKHGRSGKKRWTKLAVHIGKNWFGYLPLTTQISILGGLKSYIWLEKL